MLSIYSPKSKKTMDALIRDGVIVINGPKGIAQCDPLLNILNEQPEFKIKNPSQYVLGGFGALGHPSSFHHPDIRFIRKYVYDHVRPLLGTIYGDYNLELLFDRLCIRTKGNSLSKETWHRDICPTKLDDDIILGGWVNLGPVTQHFSGAPGTHLVNTKTTGFAKETVENINATIYKVEPGQVILFYQNLLHEIAGVKIKESSCKLFLGWRLTKSLKPIYDIDYIINNQSVPPLPSGQIPPMYAKLHRVNHKEKLENFSKLFKNELIDSKTGYIYREFPSLREIGCMFKPYNYIDKAIFFPTPF